MFCSGGSNDMASWVNFATRIQAHGLDHMYRTEVFFNHPPLMGKWATTVLYYSGLLNIPFPYFFKLPLVLFDVGLMYLIYSIRKPLDSLRDAQLAGALYALNLTAILVTAYHGNTDTYCAGLWLISAWLLTRSKDFAAGLALAAAINVKLVPVLAIPVMLAPYRDWKRCFRFLGGLSLGVIPFLPFLWSSGPQFYRNALAYKSNLELWGIEFLALYARDGGAVLGPMAARFSDFYFNHGRWVVFAAIFAVAYWARRQRKHTLAAASLVPMLFLFFAPGFGVQYTVYAAPLLAAYSPRAGIRYGTIAGVFIGLVYLAFWTGTFPASSYFNRMFPMPGPIVGFLAWLYLGVLIFRTIRDGRKRTAG